MAAVARITPIRVPRRVAAVVACVVTLPLLAAAASPARIAEQFARSCALCHISGEANAPRVGDAAAWAPRRAQGDEVLLRHTLEGLGAMPPLGYCQDCEAADFRALIDLMAPHGQESVP